MLLAHYLEPIISLFHCLRLDNWHVVVNAVTLRMLLVSLVCKEQFYTVYCKSFEVEKFCGFCRSIGKRETFTVKHFHLVLKVAGHSPGFSLKNSCDLLSALGKVSGIMLPSQNY